jgi:hypothetical protein
MVKLAEAVPPVPPFVELTVPVVFVAVPGVLSVTVAVAVQLPPPAIDPLVKTSFALVDVDTDPLVQVVAKPEPVIPVGRVSVTATPVRVVDALGFVMVSVRVELAPEAIDVGLNDLAIVGATTVAVKRAATVVVWPLPLGALNVQVLLEGVQVVLPVFVQLVNV